MGHKLFTCYVMSEDWNDAAVGVKMLTLCHTAIHRCTWSRWIQIKK